MDPTFGGQELLESLSQASASVKSRQSKDSRNSKGGNSNSSTITSAQTNNPVEDAYRKIGQGLSQRAKGDDGAASRQRQSQRARLGVHPHTSFDRYHRPSKKPFNPHDAVGGGHPVPPQGGPSQKIAKTGTLGHFQDQHHLSTGGGGVTDTNNKKPSQKYLKNITMHAKEIFQKWRRQQKAGYLNSYSSRTLSTSGSSGATSSTAAGSYQQQLQQQQQYMSLQHHTNYDSQSPQRYAFSQLALQQHEQAQLQQQQQQQLLNHQNAYLMGQGSSKVPAAPKGLLSAVLEGGSESTFESESVHSLPTISSHQTAAMSKASSVRSAPLGMNAYHQNLGHGMLHQAQSAPANINPALHFATPRGPCLTQPAVPVSNEGLDNAEGNIILYQNDILVVPGRGKGPRNNCRGLEFHVQSLLGQGTFAQVFSCWESVSKRHVALKIIKNKPAFTKQAAVEIEVFQALAKPSKDTATSASDVGGIVPTSPHTVQLLSSFMYKSHLCLVFEQLGANLYEVLKKRQFRGLPLPMVRSLVKQAMEGVKELASKAIVHCDLKPENILLLGEEVEKEVIGAGEFKSAQQKEKDTSGGMSVASASSTGSRIPQTIKLIDFGSACFEGYSAHTYIQSRFYRSPEVLMGLPYDSAIDMWSLGCVAAELFLGLPILPGVHEHDQCGRIVEMIGPIPDWMLEQGSKSTKYYVKYVQRGAPTSTSSNNNNDPMSKASPSPAFPQWRMKTQAEYISSLSDSEIRKKGGLEKLKKQPANRYFKRTKLSDIIMLHGQHCTGDEKEMLAMLVHFLYGILDPNPWKRWTAFQASQHPFLTGVSGQLRKKTADTKLDAKEENQANLLFDVFWVPPWDPGICRRKLLNVQKMREKQNAQRRGFSQPRTHGMENQDNMRGVDRSKQQSPSVNSRTQSMMVTDSPSVISHMCIDGAKNSPPSQIKMQNARNAYQRNSSSSGMSMPKHASSLSEVGAASLQASLAVEDQEKQQLNLNTPPHSNPRLLSGPQSFTSLGLEHQHHKPTEGDFGYALQRPGNIPAINSDVATVASQQSMGSLASSQGPSGSQHQGYGRMSQSSLPMNSPMERGRLYPGGNQSNNSSSLPNAAGYSNQMPGIVSGSGVSYQGGYGSNNNSFEQSGGLQYLAQQQRDNVRPQMMSDYHHQLLLQEQQKQMAALQQQHQQQLAALQQQQQLAFQQQQQHYVSQLGTTGNGYYYVTSADGTPMLVQSGGAAATMDGASYMVPTQQPQRSFDNDDGGSQSRSVRDDRGRQMPRHGRRHDHRGGAGGMSM